MKKIFFCLVLVFIFILSSTKSIKAEDIELPYGGIRTTTVPCTCTPPNLHVTVFDYRTKRALPLLYVPSVSVLYSYFNVETSTYLLGSYITAPATGLCKITVTGGDCEDLYYEGIMGYQPGTGTSKD